MQLSTMFGQTPRLPPAINRGHRWDNLFGVELELESMNEDDTVAPPGWRLHSDASLRNGVEFVTAYPMGGIILEQAIEAFYGSDFYYTKGPRTSTHIHVNMTDATVEELRAMTAIVYTIEDAIYACVEESRKWGGYSVSLSEMKPERLRNILNAPNNRTFIAAVMPPRNHERYYGFNVNLSRHGTAEFRYFPGGPTREELVSWIDLVALLKRASQKFTIQDLHTQIVGPASLVTFLSENLGAWALELLTARSAEHMFAAFETVMAMALDDENVERGGGVIRVTPALLKFTTVTLLRDNAEAAQALIDSLPKSGLLSTEDWGYYISKAKQVISGEDPFSYTRSEAVTYSIDENQRREWEDEGNEDDSGYDEREDDEREEDDEEEEGTHERASVAAPPTPVRSIETQLEFDEWVSRFAELRSHEATATLLGPNARQVEINTSILGGINFEQRVGLTPATRRRGTTISTEGWPAYFVPPTARPTGEPE